MATIAPRPTPLGTVLLKFGAASFAMWTIPLFLLYLFTNNLVPGLASLSPEAKTVVTGGTTVVAVNVIIAGYVYLALREPPTRPAPEPDAAFVSRARGQPAETGGLRRGDEGRSEKFGKEGEALVEEEKKEK